MLKYLIQDTPFTAAQVEELEAGRGVKTYHPMVANMSSVRGFLHINNHAPSTVLPLHYVPLQHPLGAGTFILHTASTLRPSWPP